MAKRKRETRWVIFAAPEQRGGGPDSNLYIAEDGKVTRNRQDAASFYTHSEARAFAKEKSISIDGAMKYIGQVDWP